MIRTAEAARIVSSWLLLIDTKRDVKHNNEKEKEEQQQEMEEASAATLCFLPLADFYRFSLFGFVFYSL